MSGGTAFAQRPAGARAGPIDTALELASFDSAWKRIRDTYHDPAMHGLDWTRVRDELRPQVERATTRAESRGAISQMLSRIGDSHFGILPRESELTTDTAVSDQPADLGLGLRYIGSDMVVIRVDSEGAAWRAGVRPGWVLEQVDTLRIASLQRSAVAATPVEETEHQRRAGSVRRLLSVIGRLQGAAGTRVLTVFRDGHDRRRSLELTRTPVRGTVVRLGSLPPIPTWLERYRLEGHNGCVGVIRFNTWMTPVAGPFEDAVAELAGCAGIVLDLRGNVGGVAAMIVGLAGHFVDRELLLGVMHTRGGELRYTANPRRVRRDGTRVEPFAGSLAVVVDGLSASTTEIFAAALQHHGRARVFGDTTAGQALPSTVMRLPNGDGMLYAIADLTDPGGRRLEGKGIVPDERVPLTRASLLAGRDDALAAARAWIESRAGAPIR